VGGQVAIAWLDVPADVLQTRLLQREREHTHFFPASLLPSQLNAVQIPDPASEPGIVKVDVGTDPPDAVARRVWGSVPALHPFVVRN
jgi:gluconate kinase